MAINFNALNKTMHFIPNNSLVKTDFSEEQAWFIRQRQIWAMASKWPEFEIVSVKELMGNSYQRSCMSKTVWVGPVQPSDLSMVYLVEVHFAPVAEDYPFVKIINPEIPYHKDIHMFSKEGSLCLFDSRIPALCAQKTPSHAYCDWVQTGIWPGNPEWNVMSLIADTTIPWTAEWLLQYEAWKITGEWLGGGHIINNPSTFGSLKKRLLIRSLNKIRKKNSRLMRR